MKIERRIFWFLFIGGEIDHTPNTGWGQTMTFVDDNMEVS